MKDDTRALARALSKLAAMPDGLPASRLTRPQLHALDAFATRTRSVTREPRGAGLVFIVTQQALVDLQLQQISPAAMSGVDGALPGRARNIAMLRSSKAGRHAHNLHHLVLRSLGSGAIWFNGVGGEFSIQRSTRDTGAVMLPIEPSDTWRSDGDLWLVENQALFDRLDWAPADAAGSLAYFRGEVSGTLLRWLATAPRARRVWMFPDYDGNGMSNLQRVAQSSACPVDLWLFPGWEVALHRFGDPALHMTNLPALRSAMESMPPATREQAKTLYEAMTRTGKALEQEAVWLVEPDAAGA